MSAQNIPKINCLIVEGNDHLQRLVHSWLVDLKIEHTQVYDGEYAVSACAQYNYGLIFLDLDSEWNGIIRNGVDAASNIRYQGLNQYAPIIGWSGDQTKSQDKSWTAAGINDFLLKPFNKAAFVDMIMKWGSPESKISIDVTPDLLEGTLAELAELAPPDFVISDLVRPKSARVLVVEDCQLTQHVICSLLKKLTNHVSQAFDGEQAISLMSTTAFDVIFMDIHMPKVNGLEATHHIRNTSNLNVYTPIIAFTSTGTLEEYSVFGVNDMLQKPFTTESLSDIFDKWTAYSKSLQVTDVPLLSTTPTFGELKPLTDTRERSLSQPNLTATSPLPTTGSNLKITNSKDGKKSPQMLRQTSDSAAFQPTSQKSAVGAWPKKKKTNALGHTAKEKMRRANIVNSCNTFRNITPTVKDADKATVFRVSVEYVTFLRNSIPADELARLDDKFVQLVSKKPLDPQNPFIEPDLNLSAALSNPDSPQSYNNSPSPNINPPSG